MLSAPRKLALVLFALVALSATGCKSNNEGKIVGKWSAEGGLLIFEFTADGKFNASGVLKVSGKYSLGTGDFVNLSDLNPPMDGKTRSKEKITINGDTMTLAGDAGKSMTFTRVK